jgi:hypothetical protein
LYLEDISDFIVECVDANFGFSRYAERLGRSANSLTNCMGRCNKNQRISMIFVIDFKENRNDKTYFVFWFPSGIYIVLLDQHNGLKPSP